LQRRCKQALFCSRRLAQSPACDGYGAVYGAFSFRNSLQRRDFGDPGRPKRNAARLSRSWRLRLRRRVARLDLRLCSRSSATTCLPRLIRRLHARSVAPSAQRQDEDKLAAGVSVDTAGRRKRVIAQLTRSSVERHDCVRSRRPYAAGSE
jgi:hypothetical protein